MGRVPATKALLDHGLHAPAIYFPSTVKENPMIEPAETESDEVRAAKTLDCACLPGGHA